MLAAVIGYNICYSSAAEAVREGIADISSVTHINRCYAAVRRSIEYSVLLKYSIYDIRIKPRARKLIRELRASQKKHSSL